MAYEYGGGGMSLGSLKAQIMQQANAGMGNGDIIYDPHVAGARKAATDRARWLKEFLPYVAQASAAEEADERRYRYQYGL